MSEQTLLQSDFKNKSQTQFKAKIVGIGAWGKDFRQWQDLQNFLSDKPWEDDGIKGPKPEIIPANERRRAPLPVRLAVESSWQASQASLYKPEELSCVFVSALGDTQLTDYMCKVLAGDSKMLSPTKFHNSVHNAAAGYWTISTGCMKAANSVAGYEESVSLTLLEALTQISIEQKPILITFYDAPVSSVLKSLLKNEYPFAVSIVLAPENVGYSGTTISAVVKNEAAQWPKLGTKGDRLNELYESTPTARVLAVLDKLRQKSTTNLVLPLSEGTSLEIQLSS